MTQETKHAPGPWVANSMGDIFDKNGNAIATTDAVPKTYNNDMANALLMAAAPDLLEVLERTMDLVGSDGYLYAKDDDGDLYYVDISDCKQAIAKALGQA